LKTRTDLFSRARLVVRLGGDFDFGGGGLQGEQGEAD